MTPKEFIVCGLLAFLLAGACWAWAGAFDSELRSGIASWYGEEYRGKTMANGQPFDPDKFTCASYAYPLGATLRVSYRDQSVIVTVTDRGPAKRLGRLIDLSHAAFHYLADPRRGVIDVEVARLD